MGVVDVALPKSGSAADDQSGEDSNGTLLKNEKSRLTILSDWKLLPRSRGEFTPQALSPADVPVAMAVLSPQISAIFALVSTSRKGNSPLTVSGLACDRIADGCDVIGGEAC